MHRVFGRTIGFNINEFFRVYNNNDMGLVE